MKILLVYPRFERFLEAYPNLAAIPTIGGLWRYRMPPALGTQILAAMMPSDVEWTIVDENVQAIDYDQEVDCVGISFFTPQAESAYAVGDRFRARGVPVLMGGMHPSIIPDDAAPHCDSICLGEVEALWPEILADLRAGGLKPRYGPRTPTASQWVRPVRGLFDDRGVKRSDGSPPRPPWTGTPSRRGATSRIAAAATTGSRRSCRSRAAARGPASTATSRPSRDRRCAFDRSTTSSTRCAGCRGATST